MPKTLSTAILFLAFFLLAEEQSSMGGNLRYIQEKIKTRLTVQNDSTGILKPENLPLHIVNKTPKSIGFILFKAPDKTCCDRLVLNFIERTLLEVYLQKFPLLADYNLQLNINGVPTNRLNPAATLELVKQIQGYTSIEIKQTELNFVLLVKTAAGQIAIGCPVNYYHLSGLDKPELDQLLANKLQDSDENKVVLKKTPVEPSSDLYSLRDSVVFSRKEFKYYRNYLNKKYYIKKTDGYAKLYSAKYGRESLENAFSFPELLGDSILIEINYHSYDKKGEMTLNLKNLLTIFNKEFEIYTAYEDDNKLNIIFYHPRYDYLHLLHISNLNSDSYLLQKLYKADFYSYIAQNNLSTITAKENPNKKPKFKKEIK